MGSRLIIIDGQTYRSIEEMPEAVRRKCEQSMSLFKDEDGNHIPDLFEKPNALADEDRDAIPDTFEELSTGSVVSRSTTIIVDGREFNSLEELPPDARARLDEAMKKLESISSERPDPLGATADRAARSVHVQTSPGQSGLKAPGQPPGNRNIAPDTTIGWRLAFLGLVVLILSVAVITLVWLALSK